MIRGLEEKKESYSVKKNFSAMWIFNFVLWNT